MKQININKKEGNKSLRWCRTKYDWYQKIDPLCTHIDADLCWNKENNGNDCGEYSEDFKICCKICEKEFVGFVEIN